jgi:hypothetical protein
VHFEIDLNNLRFSKENCMPNVLANNVNGVQVHENFKQLVDALLSDTLSDLGISVHNFIQMIARYGLTP